LATTIARHRPVPFSATASFNLDEMISHFIVRLRSMNIDLPFRNDDRRGRLEFARHYGIPSPLIDFSRSPYVALFFAFNGVRPHESTNNDYAAIYCLNIGELASVWARQRAQKLDGSIDSDRFYEEHRTFLDGNENLFVNGYEKKHNPARRAGRDGKSDTDGCREPTQIIRGGKGPRSSMQEQSTRQPRRQATEPAAGQKIRAESPSARSIVTVIPLNPKNTPHPAIGMRLCAK
jgi:hypothetical protein